MNKIIVGFLFLICSQISFGINIQAKTWLIADGDGTILEQQNIDIVQPIASITKLMTAMVYLDSNENLKENINTKFRGIVVNKQKLLDLAIVHSDNQAADMLCKIYRRGYKACINDMNHKAQVLGMQHTEFYDSTGLDNRNVSKATDLIKLLQAAERYPEIVNASNKTIVELLKNKKKKTINLRYNNTNPLVAKYNVLVSKTGYVRASGGCLVMSVYIDGKKKLFVVLNSKTTRTRIRDMEVLILSELYKSS
jgi:D-alanyl-D-alanine endopeptidase (penicillin-binding protein 7)